MDASVDLAPELPSLIEVRPPYYALEGLSSARPGHARAQVTPQQPLTGECGPLAGAEAGRHLAILGSLACASLAPDKGRHFYLARRAVLERTSRSVAPTLAQSVNLEAYGTRGKRDASAECALHWEGSTLFTLFINYQVMPEWMFHRMFAAHRRDLRARERSAEQAMPSAEVLRLRQNPHSRALPLEYEHVSRTDARAVLHHIPASICAGHFALYPAMPVARLIQGFSDLCAAVLEQRSGGPVRFVGRHAEVEAQRLAFAGQSLFFRAEHVEDDGPHSTFRARATLADGSVVGELRATIERLPGVPPTIT